MDRVAVFVDGANFFYMQKNDLKWFVDTKKLLKYCERFGEIVDAYYYVGKDAPPESGQQAFLNALTYIGYSLVTKPIKTIHVPLRAEGYGLNLPAVEELAKTYRLLVTVDLGITNAAEVARAKELGMGNAPRGGVWRGRPLALQRGRRPRRGFGQ